MLKFYYQWRYKRSQRADAFELPTMSYEPQEQSVNLGSYLTQTSVRGRDFSRFSVPRTTSKWLKWFLFLGLIAGCTWLVYESFAAMVLFR